MFRARDLLVRQRAQAINALRGHLAEYGLVVAQRRSHTAKLIDQVEDPTRNLPGSARQALNMLVDTLRSLEERIKEFDGIARRIRRRHHRWMVLWLPTQSRHRLRRCGFR